MTIANEKIDTLVASIQKLSLARSLGEITFLTRQAARKIAGSDGATVVLLEGDLCHYIDEDAISPLWKGKRFPMRTCISGWTISHRQIAVIEDIYQDERIPIDAYSPTFVKSLAMVPIRIEHPLGAIGNYWKDKHVPSAEEIELLVALANSTSIALENIARIRDLERANESLRDTLTARDEFLSVVAHELRTPLTPLKLQLQIVQRQLMEGKIEAGRSLALSLKQVDGVTGLIENLLDVSRIRVERLTLEPSVFDFADAVESAIERMLPQLRDSRCDVTRSMSNGLVGEWDRFRIEQIVTNLLSNCCKYATGTPVQISLALSSRDSVVFSVRDGGKGIPRESHAKIFERFERADRGARVISGFGLGLYITKKIVEAHKGTIAVESDLGRGANFVVELPIRRGTEES